MIKKTLLPLMLCLSLSAVFLASCSEFEENIPVPMTEMFAPKLTDYHIYQGNIKDLIPSQDYELLELNSILFSNYTEKQRLVKLPVGTQMEYDGNGVPLFPDGRKRRCCLPACVPHISRRLDRKRN